MLDDIVDRFLCAYYMDVYADLYDRLANRYVYTMMCRRVGEVT